MKRLIHLVMVLCTLPVLVAAQTSTPTFSGGDGSKEKPYLISNEADLQALAKASMSTDGDYGTGKYFLQTANITIAPAANQDNANFLGIGGKPRNAEGQVDPSDPRVFYFQGKYNGANHSITGMYVFNFIGSGFVNALGREGVIENLKFINAKIFSTLGVSGTVAAINQGIVRNCISESTFFMTLGGDTGGIVGMNMATGSIEKCVNHSSVNGSMPNCYYFGGIVGNNQGVVKECANFGNVSANYYGGGIVGYASEGSRIEYCYNTAKVACRGTDEASGAGGIVGCLWSNNADKPAPVVLNSYNYGAVSVQKTLANRCAGGITGFISPALAVNVQNCYYDQVNSLVTDPLATALPPEEMKAALTQLNGGATTPVYVADLATPINSGYPIFSWQAGIENPQPEADKMQMQFAEITIPVGVPYCMLATSCPPPSAPGKKIYWRYVSEDPKVEGAVNVFEGQDVCSTEIKKRAGHVENNVMTEVLGEASFKVKVVPADQYKPTFIEPILHWGNNREQIKAAEAARGYRLFTKEYFEVAHAQPDPSYEIFLTDNTQFPIIMYTFNENEDKLEDAYLISSSTFIVLSPKGAFADFMTSQKGYDIYGVSPSVSNVYHHPSTKVTAQAIMVRIQAGPYGGIAYAYDPNKSIANQALSIATPTTEAERAVVSVVNREVLILPATMEKTAVTIYSIDGQIVASSIVESQGRIPLPSPGVYIVQIGKHAQKIVIE